MKRIGLHKNLILLAVSIFVSMPVTGFPGRHRHESDSGVSAAGDGGRGGVARNVVCDEE